VYRGNNDIDKLHLMALLLQDAASDWFDGLDDEIKVEWRALKDAFIQRFEDTEVLRWRRANELLQHRVQGPSETVDDYVTAMRKLARSLGINGDTELYAIQRGLRPEFLAAVIRAQATTIDDVLKTTRVAETAATIVKMTTMLTDTTVDRAISDASVTSQQATENFHKLTETTTQSTTSEHDNSSSSACTSASTVTTTTTSQRRVDNAVAEGRQLSERQRSSRNHQNRGPSNDYMHVNLIFCAFCGSQHEAGKEFCKAASAQCYKCGKLGHLWRMCHSQLQGNVTPESTQRMTLKRNWNLNFSSGFDYNQSPRSPRNMRHI